MNHRELISEKWRIVCDDDCPGLFRIWPPLVDRPMVLPSYSIRSARRRIERICRLVTS